MGTTLPLLGGVLVLVLTSVVLILVHKHLSKKSAARIAEAEFQVRFQPFLEEVLALPTGPALIFKTNYSYTGLLVRNPQFGTLKKKVTVTLRKAKYAARLYFKALEQGDVRPRSFSSQSELVLYVHQNISEVYSSSELFGI